LRSWGMLIAIILVTGLVFNSKPAAAGFNIEAGLGYDFLSQKYFLEEIQQEGSDSILVDWELRSTYLDDLKGLLAIEYKSPAKNKVKIRTTYEQTADFLRLKFSSDFKFKPGKNRLDFYSDFEWRNSWEDSSEFGNSYLFGSVRSKFRIPFGKSVSGIFQLKTEQVKFQSSSESSFDYYRISGYGGIEKAFDNFSFLDLKLFMSYRKVPDSTRLDYNSFGIEGTFFGTLPIGSSDIVTRWETKDYNKEDYQSDYSRGELNVRNKLNINDLWISRQEIDLEIMLYDDLELISNNYCRLNLLLMGGMDWINFSLASGPEFELLKEEANPEFDTEDYLESGFRIDLDYMNPGKILLSLESTIGIRNLEFESDLQTDFVFERVNLISDFNVINDLNLNLIFSAEWEWHDDKEDNNEIYLLSSSLIYKF